MVPSLFLLVGLASGLVPTQTTDRVSIDSDGLEAIGASVSPAISGDGQFVAFQSNAPLAANASGFTDIYIRDRIRNYTVLISKPMLGPANSFSTAATLSSDGRFIAFQSAATNLVAGDTNGFDDVFFLDRDPDGNGVFDEGNSILQRISVDSLGLEGNAPSNLPDISADGRYVAFFSLANNLVVGDANSVGDVFVWDRNADQLTLLSLSSLGAQGDAPSGPASLSSTGRFLAFSSHATNFDPTDTNGLQDIYRRDRDPDGNGIFDEGNGITVRISIGSSGNEPDSACSMADIAGDGSRVVFQSAASNLAAGGTTPGRDHIYLRTTPVGTTSLVSQNLNGNEPNGLSANPRISLNGDSVVFQSRASDLILGDTNGWDDVFLAHLSGGWINRVSVDGPGNQVTIFSKQPAIGESSAEIAFQSPDDGLVPHDLNGTIDIFVRSENSWSPQLLVDPIFRGQVATTFVYNADPFEKVWILYSTSGLGPGSCFAQLGGLCLDILDPITLSGSAIADAYGSAMFQSFVPISVPLIPVYLQAVIQRGPGKIDSVKSNPVSRTILP
jgi:WD40 repeat protein